MNCFRGFLLAVCLIGCRNQASPAPEPPAAKKEPGTQLAEIGATTLALPSSSIIAVTGKGVTAFGPSGNLVWTFKLPGQDGLTARPAAAPNSYLYLRGARTVYAVGPEGKQAWAADIEPGVGAFPTLAVLTDSSVVAVIGDVALTCLTTTGTVRWTYKLPDGAKIIGEPTSAPNGFLLLRTKDRLYALNSDGQLQWSTVVPSP